MKDGPAFQLYAADFYMDTISWTNEEIGIYLRLLLSEWINGPLDFNARKLASISQISARKFGIKWVKIGEKFTENKDGKLINERLEEVREKQRLWREKSSLGGKKSAEIRARVVQPPYQANKQPNGQPKGNSSSLSSSSIKETNRKKEVDYSQLQKKTDRLCKTLNGYFHKFNFYAWRQEQINKQKHPEGIEECLSLLWDNRKTVINVRAYLTQLMKIKGPNAFEREAMAEHKKRKKEELSYDRKTI